MCLPHRAMHFENPNDKIAESPKKKYRQHDEINTQLFVIEIDI
jgi:hypothetical protein